MVGENGDGDGRGYGDDASNPIDDDAPVCNVGGRWGSAAWDAIGDDKSRLDRERRDDVKDDDADAIFFFRRFGRI